MIVGQRRDAELNMRISGTRGWDAYSDLFNVFSVLATGIDDESDVENRHDDHCHIDGLVLGEFSIGKCKLSTDWVWKG